MNLVNVTHNHKPTSDVRVFSVARKSFDVDAQRFLSGNLEAGTEANNLLGDLMKGFPECKLVVKKIYNMIVQYKKYQLQGEDEMTALMRKIVADEAVHCTKVNCNGSPTTTYCSTSTDFTITDCSDSQFPSKCRSTQRKIDQIR